MIVITLGDPLSINIEQVANLLRTQRFAARNVTAILIVGSKWHWQNQMSRLGYLAQDIVLESIETIDSFMSDVVRPRHGLSGAKGPNVYFYDVGGVEHVAEDLNSHQRGDIATRSLIALKEVSREWEALPHVATEKLSVLTSPIDKLACYDAGFGFPGQTEFFQDMWGQQGIMLLAGPKLKVGLVTNHLPLSDVEQNITTETIHQKLESLIIALRQTYGIRMPRIGVAGLNPHCGDGGMFGSFDLEIVAPAIKSFGHNSFEHAEASLPVRNPKCIQIESVNRDGKNSVVGRLSGALKRTGSTPQVLPQRNILPSARCHLKVGGTVLLCEVTGPLPADTIFWSALQGEFDAVLAMYHDQGLGPLKTIHFDEAVNLTGGLPHLRVSPDHGPARDLFLTKTSSAKSFIESARVICNYHEEPMIESG